MDIEAEIVLCAEARVTSVELFVKIKHDRREVQVDTSSFVQKKTKAKGRTKPKVKPKAMEAHVSIV